MGGGSRRVCVSVTSSLGRALEFILALYVVAVAGYHIRRITTSDDDLSVSPQLYAIIVIAGVAALYTLLTSITIWFVPGVFHVLHFALELLFTGGFIALSVLLRHAASAPCDRPSSLSSSNSALTLWIASSGDEDPAYTDDRSRTCKIDKAAFAASVANAVFLLLTAALSYLFFKRYRKNRAFGPGPSNNYSFRHRVASKKRKKSEEAALAAAAASSAAGGNSPPTAAPALAEQDNYGGREYGDGAQQPIGAYTRSPVYGGGGGLGGRRRSHGQAAPLPAELSASQDPSELEPGNDAYAAYKGAGGFNPALKEGPYAGNF